MKEGQTGNGQVNVLNFRNALSPEATKYLHAPSSMNSRVAQTIAGGNITFEVLDLPAGPVPAALGGEYRRESSEVEFDALAQTGLNAGNATRAPNVNMPRRRYALNQSYGGADTSFCQYITRRQSAIGVNSVGSLELIGQTNANTGGDFVEGIDVTANYATRIRGGAFNSRIAYTFMKKAYNRPTPDAPQDRFDGEVDQPKPRWTLNVGYNIGDSGLNAITPYIGQCPAQEHLHVRDPLSSGVSISDCKVCVPTSNVVAKYLFSLTFFGLCIH